MAVGGVLCNGTKVGFSAASPVSWTRVAQLIDIPQFISLVSNQVDTTVHSTSRIMTQMPGMIPAPDIKLDLLADLDQATGTSHESLRSYQTAGTTLYWRVEIPVDRNQSSFRAFEFQAFVKEWTVSTKIGEAQKLSVTLTYGGGYWVQNAGASAIT